jgi:hypothetical protein
MATKKKSAIEARQGHPAGIIDDIIGMGTKLVQKKTKDAARAYVAAGRPMRREAKKIGKLQKEYSSTSRSGLGGDANVIRGKELRAEARKANEVKEIHYLGRKGMVRDIEKTTGKPMKRVRKKAYSENVKLRKISKQY